MLREDAPGRRPASLPVRVPAPWRALRAVCLAGLAAVGLGLVFRPGWTLPLLWWGVVPLLPALFLVHPRLWRNVCPLATLSMGRSPGEADRGGRAGSTLRAGAAGIAPLLLLVAVRALGVDGDATATGVVLAGLTGVAVVAGRRGVRRSGFCNRFCPLLPVERLYGQRPVVSVADDRCPSCSLCTPRGCLDLSETAATPQLLGPARSGSGWLLTPFGAFAAGFPGFVVAWFWWTGASPGGPVGLVGVLLAGSCASWGAAATVIRLGRIPWDRAMPTLAALAAGAYYAGAAPRAVAAFGGDETLGLVLRGVSVGAVAWWWLRILAAPREPRIPAAG